LKEAPLPKLPNLASFLTLALAVFCALSWSQPAKAGFDFGVIITVNSTSDAVNPGPGLCTLRAAITAANSNATTGNCAGGGLGADVIQFDIGSGTPLINVATPLPNVGSDVSINGNTFGATRVELRGPGGSPGQFVGLNISGNGVAVQSLVVNNFLDAGIRVTGNNFNLRGSYIGVDATGTVQVPNLGNGVSLFGSNDKIDGTTNGGPCTGDCNLISGNGQDQVFIDTTASSTLVRGSFIGTYASGVSPTGNPNAGIRIRGTLTGIGATQGTTPGGPCTGGCNLISGNTNGIIGEDTGAATVSGNFIGTDVTGMVRLRNNGGDGVHATGSGHWAIGLGTPESRNVISGNADQIDASVALSIRGNYIGTNAAGTAGFTYPGISRGIYISGPDAFIGGGDGHGPGTSCSGQCNLISLGSGVGSGSVGIELDSGATSALVAGNYIGTDVTGTMSLGNGPSSSGVVARAAGARIGTANGAEGNVIAGNSFANVRVSGGTNSLVQNNYIGVDTFGSSVLAGNGIGVFVSNADGVNVGGSNQGEGNVIGGSSTNGQVGLSIENANGTIVQGNRIGVNGSTPIPNDAYGVLLFQGTITNTVIGGEGLAANEIAFNGVHGIDINAISANEPVTDTIIAGNSIHDNGNSGVRLSGAFALRNHITQNAIYDDGGLGIDPSDGANAGLAPPTLTLVEPTEADDATRVMGTYDGLPNFTHTIEFFSSPACDPSGFGEGKTYLDAATIQADGSGHASFDKVLIPPVTAGFGITATLTDKDNNTSEFSNCLIVPGPTPTPSPTPSPTPTASPTPTPTASPSPSPTPIMLVQGDLDCDGDVDLDDFEFLLAYASGLNDGTTPGACPDLGVATPASVSHLWGDVNCDGSINPLDSLFVLAHRAEIELGQTLPCTAIGTELT
jgi:CSLREA domain-containing protein